MATNQGIYQFNAKAHVKIWLSSKPHLFMNFENKMRLAIMREDNPTDSIHLVYDSSLLNTLALQELKAFCDEYHIIPIDANQFANVLSTLQEKKLYSFYQDEINHLQEGGNLGVASDIIRWLSPVYTKGSYTDFDVPVDTSKLQPLLPVGAPLLLNIGGLRLGKKEMIFSNNDFISVVDPIAAQPVIDLIQKGLIKNLEHYDNDFIEKVVAEFSQDSIINPYLIGFLQNRAEAVYILKSKQNFEPSASRQLRYLIQQITADPKLYLEFCRQSPNEGDEEVILKLRLGLKQELNLFKRLFFRSEYSAIKQALRLADEPMLQYVMLREKINYLKSITVCTAGPVALAKFLFKGYVFKLDDFERMVAPYSFNRYGLKQFFKSKNSLAMHTNAFKMLRFLGTEEGVLNDSSWLEVGERLQQSRAESLEQYRQMLALSIPKSLLEIQLNLTNRLHQLESTSKSKHQEEIIFLQTLVTCYDEQVFNTALFLALHSQMPANLSRSSRKLLNRLQSLQSQAFRHLLTHNKKIDLLPAQNMPNYTEINTSFSWPIVG